ncbi:tetratricopeptide domain protein [Oleiphilus messinensis]|uniref:Tetratricopeptide domain protein n=1 Tax=Oleiphilus messinensis TaxID=141451 RepID=A0A1Y0I2B0_9GAMM|nr:hypothetical protein [Oleiphilus messinensis]ARU54349.1 tetratricopeptide domain protein [Oleiphilus messinensis]
MKIPPIKPILMASALIAAVSAQAEQNGQEKIDYVQLGATLLQDGYVQRAKTVLEKVDIRKPDFDYVTYYTLKGVMNHELGYPLVSNRFLEHAIALGQSKKSIYLYIARNHWQDLNYTGVIEALDKAGEAATNSEQMFAIKAEAYKQLGQMKQAWATLDAGIAHFPDYARFYSQKFYYLLELGYFQTALEYAQHYLQKQNYSAKDYLAMAFALRENNRLMDAAVLLEEGVIKHPADDKLLEMLGQVYIDQEQYLIAALVMDWASIQFPRFAHRAATLYLKAGDPIRSLQLNRRIGDQKEKFQQRLGIDIELEDYESLVAKTESLKRYDLLKDDNIVYALGYAHFMIRNFDTAKQYLQRINDNQLFTQASQLFQQIEKCQDEPIECR